jgi:hypothetical protein
MSCETCGEKSRKKCSVCRTVGYCSVKCQKENWLVHKLICKKFGDIEIIVRYYLDLNYAKISDYFIKDIQTFIHDDELKVLAAWFKFCSAKLERDNIYKIYIISKFDKIKNEMMNGKYSFKILALNSAVEKHQPYRYLTIEGAINLNELGKKFSDLVNSTDVFGNIRCDTFEIYLSKIYRAEGLYKMIGKIPDDVEVSVVTYLENNVNFNSWWLKFEESHKDRITPINPVANYMRFMHKNFDYNQE